MLLETIIIVQLIRLTHLTFHDSGHGFISKKSSYFDEDLSQIHLNYFQNVDSLEGLNLRFDPEVLDFRERPLGSPHSRTVTLYNTNSNKSIDLTSISGNTVHFHSSFFEDKQIPPNGNTTFKVVYLGRQEGPVESTLFLHTSNGFIKYKVKAFGTFNSYRVRPIVGVKLPINSTFTPVIYMHNPHSEPIQIVEIYSSGGGFHLELPGGQHEGSNDLWEINPQETKAVIRVRFEAKLPHNHTAYIRIKLHNPQEILIVPLEVEVTQGQNIFHPQGHVDFGMGGSMDEPKEVDLCLFNPLKRAIRVHSVSTLSKSIKTQYYNIRINPSEQENKCVNVGTLTLDWKNAHQTNDYYGKIIVKFRSGKNRTEIPYFLTVLKGGLSYDKMSTTYFLNDKEMDTKERKFEILNEFFHPVKILDIKFPFDIDSTFKIQTHTPITIKPFEKKPLFNIWLKTETKKTDIQLTSHIKILTNISNIQVPLMSYNGKIQIYLPFTNEDKILDVGLLGHNKKVQILITLANPNPVPLPLLDLSCSIPFSQLELLGCGTGDHKQVLMYNSFENLTECDTIEAQGYAVVKLIIKTREEDGQKKENIYIQTPFENLSLPVYYRVAPGEIIIDRDDLVFDNCFPAKTCSHPLRVFSSFSEKMLVLNVLPLPPDKRISASMTSMILPKINHIIGHLYFNPNLDCSPECYTGFVSESTASWLRTLPISKQVSEYDLRLVNTFYSRYLNFTQKALRNVTFRMDTSDVKGQTFVSKINYTWPSLIKDNLNTLQFPLTQIHNSSFKTLHLQNPANYSVVVQLLFENDYPHAEMLYDGLPISFIPYSEVKYTSNNWFSFDERLMENQRKYFFEHLGVGVYKASLTFLLLPGQSRKVCLEFKAEEPRAYSSLLLIRNNLTIIEVVRLNGKGTVPRFEFAGLRPGDLKPLQFDLSEKQLKYCNKELHSNPYLPDLTVKESFWARNLGEIPVQVNSFSINGFWCEGFGFKVLDCESFTLLPNCSKKIELAFTPDLTLQEITRVLIIGTSINTFVNYSLKATIPRSYCRHCSLLLQRPPWESSMAFAVNIFLAVMLFLVVMVAILDSNTIKNKAIEIYMASNAPPLMPVWDLKKIGKQVREEIQSALKEKAKADSNEGASPEDCVKSEPAIIPTTGRAKRKLNHKNSSNEQAEEERRQKKKDILYERHRLKSRERKTEKELKLLEDKGRKEKHAQQINDTKKNVAPAKKPNKSQEEEISSTTTESSNSSTNCDEIDKENQRSSWPKQKDDTKIKHVSFVNSKLKHTDQDKTEQKRRQFKERKDKLIYRHKTKQVEAAVEKEPSLKTPPASFFIPLPTVSTSCAAWCENKARFSDVVARQEQHEELNPSPLKTKPTVYVEPFKPVDLGPIGSKRLGTPESNSPDLFNNRPQEFHPINDTSVIAVANNPFLGDQWPRQQVFRDITDESLFTDESWKVPQHPTTNDWSNTFSTVLNSTSKLANNASYLWGSPIWKPWSPADSPSAVRRTPPGFDDQIQKQKRAAEEQKMKEPYDLGAGATWNQPWE
ncbi:unnamed protein product [Ceutorhynchus assimilis]|uniref:Transmembrane protein 131 n=1 Tax=Ceutorhynchus assimilis TaxID=467358 RepID=A0A9N9MLQ8_9CUCU|nr:unnamed protein product [Ceutorhynchus assimilis]